MGGGLIGLASENVTRRERANRAAVAMNEALSRSNAELDRFASVASHDLQEPPFGDRLASHAGDKLDPRGHDYLQRMRSASSRMRDLIDDLLRLSRVRGMERETKQVSLGATVAEVLVDLESAIVENGARVEVGPLPTVAGNATLFRQLFQNLLGNALKFQPPGQAARISVRPGLAPGHDPPRGQRDWHRRGARQAHLRALPEAPRPWPCRATSDEPGPTSLPHGR